MSACACLLLLMLTLFFACCCYCCSWLCFFSAAAVTVASVAGAAVFVDVIADVVALITASVVTTSAVCWCSYYCCCCYYCCFWLFVDAAAITAAAAFTVIVLNVILSWLLLSNPAKLFLNLTRTSFQVLKSCPDSYINTHSHKDGLLTPNDDAIQRFFFQYSSTTTRHTRRSPPRYSGLLWHCLIQGSIVEAERQIYDWEKLTSPGCRGGSRRCCECGRKWNYPHLRASFHFVIGPNYCWNTWE